MLQHVQLPGTAWPEVQLLVHITEVAEGKAVLFPRARTDSRKAKCASRKQKLVEILLTHNNSKSQKATG